MSNKLNKQVASITGMDMDHVMRVRIAWISAYNNREKFLADLREGIAKMEYSGEFDHYDPKKSKKLKSKFYSDNVVAYDSRNRQLQY